MATEVCYQEFVEIGPRVRALREARGLSQQRLCALAGNLSLSQLQNIEGGQTLGPRLDTITALAKGLGMPLWRLIYEVEMGREPEAEAGAMGERASAEDFSRKPEEKA